MMRKAEQEISSKVIEAMKRLEDPVYSAKLILVDREAEVPAEEERIVRKLGWNQKPLQSVWLRAWRAAWKGKAVLAKEAALSRRCSHTLSLLSTQFWLVLDIRGHSASALHPSSE